jgi:hypothetical protein
LIADNLGWFEGNAKNIQEMAELKGEKIEIKSVYEIVPPKVKIGETETTTSTTKTPSGEDLN